MDLRELRPTPGSTRRRRRVARGPGSGTGKTAGRGHKGRGSRSGGTTPPGYEGGQMPLRRRLPKRGFRPLAHVEHAVIGLGQLAGFEAGTIVDVDALRARGLVRTGRPVKCLANGVLDHALTVRVHAFSRRAREAIEAAGGQAEVIGG
jgi:large subunit ribosomal protein L15